jgi:hypothetical protein
MSFKLGHVSIPKRPIFLHLFLFCAYNSSVLHRYSYMVKYLIKFVVIINRRWEKLIYLWASSFFFSWSWFQNIAPK